MIRSTSTRKRRAWAWWVGALLLLPVAIAGGWVVTETAVQRTSDAAFCGRCHSTMTPFVTTHAADLHGGANDSGWIAACNDCHLPHDNAARHLVAKGVTGVRDVWAQLRYPEHQPDWLGNLDRRAEYVFDSGCLGCHAGLEQAAPNRAHQAWFNAVDAGDEPRSCVDCHRHVGHHDLRVAIEQHFDPRPRSGTPSP